MTALRWLFRPVRLGAGTLVLCGFLSTTSAAEQHLLSAEGEAVIAAMPLPAREPELRSRMARFDRPLLDQLARAPLTDAQQRPRLVLDFFDDVAFTIEVQRVADYGKGRFVIHGALVEEGKATKGFAVLSVVDEALQAEITTLDGRKFTINHAGGDFCRISELAPEAMEIHCAVDNAGNTDAANPAGAAHIPAGSDFHPTTDDTAALAAEGEPPVVDLMIVYTRAIQQKFSGTGAMDAHCQLAAEAANRVFLSSNIRARVRLVRSQQVEYVESGEVGKDLLRLGDPNDGFLDDVPALREQYGADVVHLFGASGFSGAGMATGYPSEYHSVLMGGNTNTFVHELGHNFGCQHDRAAAGSGAGVSYAFGNIFEGDDGNNWGCIMSYTGNAGAIQLSQFSNPDISHRGAPTGVRKGLPGAADNARMVDNTAPVIAAYRQPDGSSSRVPVFANPPGVTFARTAAGSVSPQQSIRLTYASASQWRPVQISELRVNGEAAGEFTVVVQDGSTGQVLTGDSFTITPPAGLVLVTRHRPTTENRAEATITFTVDEPSHRYPMPPIRLVGNANTPLVKNISTRGRVGAGDDALIGGFIIGGNAPREVLVRAVGPSLADRGVSGALPDPVMELYRGSELIAQNDDWIDGFPRESIRWTGIAPAKDLESAILMKLEPGSYTAVVRGHLGSTGVGMIEAYDLEANEQAQFLNISTRGEVSTGDDVMIGGFILGGASPTRVLVRALGPSLTAAGVAGALGDPTLDVHNAQGTRISSNDDWRSDDEGAISDTKIPPADDREAAAVLTLPPGAYTAVVRGANATRGIGLVELYKLAAE